MKPTTFEVKTRKEYTEVDMKKIENKYKAKKPQSMVLVLMNITGSQLVNLQRKFVIVFEMHMKNQEGEGLKGVHSYYSI